MIVMDEKSDKIHAVMKNDLMPAFESSLVDGNVLFLSKFSVAANKGRYTVLNNKFKLNFYRATEVKRVSAFDGPTHGFSFVPFRDVFNYIGDQNLPVDIIGSVVDCGNMEVYNKKEDKEGKRLTLDLQDLDGMKLKCTLWDAFAQQFHDYLAANNFEHHVVIVVQFGRLKDWKARVITGTNIGFETLIPRMKLSPTDKSLPFKITRKQFPISMCFAMTINKSQGQSLSHVGLFLPRPVFTHGQLYVALSRVKTKNGLKLLICDNDMNVYSITKNVVYKEVLQRL